MRALLMTVCLMLPLSAAADVYQWVDQEGNTVYSDSPRPGARRVELPPSPPPSPPQPPAPPAPAPAPQPSAEIGPVVSSVAIVRPGNGETIHDNSGNVQVELAVQPPVGPGQTPGFRVYLDGEPVPGLQTAASFTLSGLGRGSHTLQVAAVDRAGNTMAASAAVTFEMWHASAIFETPTPPGTFQRTFPKAPTAPTAPAAPRAP